MNSHFSQQHAVAGRRHHIHVTPGSFSELPLHGLYDGSLWKIVWGSSHRGWRDCTVSLMDIGRCVLYNVLVINPCVMVRRRGPKKKMFELIAEFHGSIFYTLGAVLIWSAKTMTTFFRRLPFFIERNGIKTMLWWLELSILTIPSTNMFRRD